MPVAMSRSLNYEASDRRVRIAIRRGDKGDSRAEANDWRRMSEPGTGENERFPTTHWTRIVAAGLGAARRIGTHWRSCAGLTGIRCTP